MANTNLINNHSGAVGVKLSSLQPVGVKFDSGKPQYGLFPPFALEEVAKVLTYGAQKYMPNNWRHVDNSPKRYFDAAQRHMWAIARGEFNDSESGYPHAAHAATCLLFLMEYQMGTVQKTADFLKTTEK